MSRLVAFGCSNTYGEGLPDCWRNMVPGPKPSKYVWPQLLANDLNLECVNLSVPGTSNKQICNDILNTDFKSTDIVVIMWTFFSRTCFFQDEGKSKRIMVQDITNKNFKSDRQQYNNTYYKTFYTQTNSNIENYMYINLIQLMLKEKEISNYHISCNQTQGKLIFDDSPPDWNQTDVYNVSGACVDIALDNSHPGTESQKEFFRRIKKHIKGKSNDI
tara:strand:+ start:181 stop:831 length:651 start_codon:yes stop_codon:yes gene_type:complete